MTSRTATFSLLVGVMCIALCLGLYGCGRYTFASVWSFEGPTSQGAAPGVVMSMRIDSKPKVRSTGIANLKMMAKTTSPYDLRMGFYTGTNDAPVQTAVLRRVAIRYQDGEKIEVIVPNQQKLMLFESRLTSNWNGTNIVYHESLVTGITVTNCIAKNLSLAVECEGMFVYPKGEEVPFSVKWIFRPKKLSGFVPSYCLDPDVMNSELPRP